MDILSDKTFHQSSATLTATSHKPAYLGKMLGEGEDRALK